MNQDHIESIEKVTSYIEANFSKQITLDQLALISNLSKYHFSRIFKQVLNVSPIEYLNIRRLHKSIHFLKKSSKSILEISSLCGFESLSTFNKSFKKYFEKTPSEMRNDLSNIPLSLSNIQEEISSPYRYNNSNNNFLRRIWEMNITIKSLPNLDIAYVRKKGSYFETGEAWDQLMKWTFENQLFPPKSQFIGISLDNPNSVDEYECRYDACVTLPKDFMKNNSTTVEFRTLPGGLYALYHFYDTNDKLGITYQSIYNKWLPNSQFEADNRHCLEFIMNNPFEDPEGKSKVDLYIPIRKK